MSAQIVSYKYLNARRLVKLLQKAKEQAERESCQHVWREQYCGMTDTTWWRCKVCGKPDELGGDAIERKRVTCDNLRGQGPAWDIEADEFDAENDEPEGAA